MALLARIIAPGIPHHVTQRGNRRAQIFWGEADYLTYLVRLQADCVRRGLAILAYCLMPNHIHLIAIPDTALSLSTTLRDTHTAFAVYRNHLDQCTGHVWQGRFFSCVLDGAHLWAAMRYVERNPVRAGLVTTASEYRWSSAAAHCGLSADPLLAALPAESEFIGDWAAWLHDEDPIEIAMLRQRTHTGRPMGSPEFHTYLESLLARAVTPRKRGRKAKRQVDE